MSMHQFCIFNYLIYFYSDSLFAYNLETNIKRYIDIERYVSLAEKYFYESSSTEKNHVIKLHNEIMQLR